MQPDLDLMGFDHAFEYSSKISDITILDPDAMVGEVKLAYFWSIYKTLQDMSRNMIPRDEPHLLKHSAWIE